MELKKPDSVASDSFCSAKWDELTDGREFSPSDIPTLTLLVRWYQVVDQCIEDISRGTGVQVAYENTFGDLKAVPQLSTMKQASAEIRALNKQLGINDGKDSGFSEPKKKSKSVLQLVVDDRATKAQRAAGE